MRIIVLLLLLIPGCLSCRGGSGGKPKPTNSPTPPTSRYNCTHRDEQFITEVTVRNITNTTEVLCMTILEVPDYIKNVSDSDEETWLCNHLGNAVCPGCANDTLYKTNYSGINISCSIEEATTTTISATTVQITSANKAEESTTAASQGFGLENILIIVACVVVLLVLIVVLILCKRKRNQEGKKQQNGTQEPAVRVQSDETGELYTVVNKPQNDSTNAYADDRGTLYLAAEDVEIIENGELYTEVDKVKIKNGSSKSRKQKGKKQNGVHGRDTVQEVLYDSNPAGQEANNELYSVVDKGKSQNGGGGDDGQLYNVLYKDGQ